MKKAVFIDRDGTLNKHVGFIWKPTQIRLVFGATQAIKLLNKKGYLAIVVTNQPGVARNIMTEKGLALVNLELERRIVHAKAYLTALYVCPHHPDKGYPEENKKLKIKCDCRKPNIGLIKKAVEDHDIDLSKSYMIGDSTTDLQLAKNAGLKSVLVKTGYSGLDGKYTAEPTWVADDVHDAVKLIVQNDNLPNAPKN